MYNCAPRDIDFANHQSSPYLGPTTYILDEQDTKVNCVPFLNTARRFFEHKGVFCDTYYDLPGAVQHVKGGSSLRNRELRFKYGTSASKKRSRPKSSYSTHTRDKYGKPREQSEKDDPCRVPTRKLYVCPVPYSAKGSAPTMPIDSFGYSLTKNDSIIKIIPPYKDMTLGPAYYRVSDRVGDIYKGCKWSARTEKRTTYHVQPGPGPGTYNVELPKRLKDIEEEKNREMARRFSYIPRFLEAQEMKIKRENLPGPDRYHVVEGNICKLCPSAKPRPFICGGKARGDLIVNNNPGPGDYELTTVSYPVSKKNVPFSVQSPRFRKKRVERTPGPATYNLKSPFVEKLLKKMNPYAIYPVPFNNTAERKTLEISPDAADTPSPANYFADYRAGCKLFTTSVFKSKTHRFKKFCRKNDVGPDTYEVTRAFNDSVRHKSHQAMEISFNTTQKRKSIPVRTGFPGPADYCSQLGLSSKGHYIPVSPRFDDAPFGPGPGSYHIHPSYGNSLYGASNTFNFRIKESVLKKKLQRGSKESWFKWATNLKTKKTLNCFFDS